MTPPSADYQLLQTHLEDRFADRVVLTFAEIEALIGFSLPDEARLQQRWWEVADHEPRTAQSQSWTLAHRTASANLLARTVVFDRETPPSSKTGKR